MNSTLVRITLCLSACFSLIFAHVSASNPVDEQKTEIEHTANNSQPPTSSKSDNSSITSSSISIDRILKLPSPTVQQALLTQAVGELLENEAFEFVSECESISDSDQREMFLKTIFSHLTKLDIRRTLHRFDALRPSDQTAVVDSIYKNVEMIDDRFALHSLAEFPWDLQEIALAAFLSEPRRSTEEELVAIAEIVPAMVVPLLTEIKNRDKLRDFSEKLIRHWAIKEHPIAITLIKDLHETMLFEWLLIHTTIALSHTHPSEALRLTHDYHREFGFTFEERVFNRIAKSNPDMARKLVATLRPRYLPRPSLFDLQATIFTLDPVLAIEFGKSLSDRESKLFFESLKYDFCWSSPQLLIDVIDLIPFAEAASAASKCVLFKSRRNDKLTQEDFDLLYSSLLSEDREDVDKYAKSSFIRELNL